MRRACFPAQKNGGVSFEALCPFKAQTRPFLHNPQVYRNCVERDSNFDIMASIELGSEEELHAYLTHPLHMQMAADMKDVLCGRTSFDHE